MARLPIMVGAVSILALTAGCAGRDVGTPSASYAQAPAPEVRKPLISPQDGRRMILAEKAHMWKDPDSIKEASIGEPHACTHPTFPGGGVQIVNVPASCICLELNAKNSYGGYTGIKRTVAVLLDSGGIATKDGAYSGFEEYCRNMKPFSELNGRVAAR